MAGEHNEDDRRRLRSAIFGSATLTRADAEMLSQRFPYSGSGASRAFQILAPVMFAYFAVVVVLDVVHHAAVGRFVLPVIFAVVGILNTVQRVRVTRKIQHALAASTD